jgi:hypothetical protein
MDGKLDIVPEQERWLEEAEQTRRRNSRKLTRMLIVVLASFTVFFGTLVAAANALLSTPVTILLVIGSLMTAFTAGAIYYYDHKDLQAVIKQQLIAPIVRQIDQGLEYLPKKGLKEADLQHASLFPYTNTMQSSDMLRGRYGKTDFVCAHVEIHQLGQKRYRKGFWDNGKFENTTPTFSGLMIIADSNKHFKGRTLVVPDEVEQYLGRWFSKQFAKLRYRRLQNVELEDPEFERVFEVYTTDQVEARYLLTPDIMRELLWLQRTLNRELRVAFYQNRVYITIDEVENLNLNLYRPLEAQQAEKQVKTQWELIRTVIDTLGLNERLWTKE